jgi:uncharacterized protein (TIGR04168 family)
MVSIAIIGDIHGDFDTTDVQYFNRSDYDLLLFLGDLCWVPWRRTVRRMARRIAQVQKPALFIPGNHDVANPFQALAERLHSHWLARLLGRGHLRHDQRLQHWLQPVMMCGYSVHPIRTGGLSFDVVAARPYARGRSELSFAPFLRKRFGVQTLEDSIKLLQQRIDQTESERLIFLAHTGPYGLGDQPSDIWGCDFDPRGGDYGDRDLTVAIEYARSHGKEVLAVVAGHMHLQTNQGRERPWHVQRDGTHYINAARVPRTFTRAGQELHHHVSLTILPADVSVTEVLAVS